MIEYLKQNNNANLILFVHGFIGGRETWISDEKNKRLPYYLQENKEINDRYDLALFNYYSQLTDKLERVKWIASFLKGGKKLRQNLSISDLADLLYSEIQVNLKQYRNIIIIAHSMGGLVSKACIIKSRERNTNQNIKAYISLAVPHNGSNLANIGKAILNNPHVRDLAPLEAFINEINTKWIGRNDLPPTHYYQGKADIIVPKTSSIGYDRRQIEPVYSDDDHFSILKPENGNDVIITSIIDTVLSLGKEPETFSVDIPGNNNSSGGDVFTNISGSNIINKSNFRNK